MNNRQSQALSIALYGIAVALGFILGTARTGVVVAVVGAVLLSVVFRFTRPAGTLTGGRNRNRNRR